MILIRRMLLAAQYREKRGAQPRQRDPVAIRAATNVNEMQSATAAGHSAFAGQTVLVHVQREYQRRCRVIGGTCG